MSAAAVESPPKSPSTSKATIDNDKQQRPATRPKRFNLDLETNPFEMSFSRSSASSVPSVNNTNGNGHNNNGSNSPKSSRSPRTPPGAQSNGPSGAPQPSPKPTLPPLSAIAEGSEAGAFPWGFSASDLASSLRSGPLSPAMLAGPTQRNATSTDPQHHQTAAVHALTHGGYFDPANSFRTGLTPGVGRTGLTPLVGGPASFPPPSPNTAAFLAMVTNNASSAQVNSLTGGATITPNTLSALTGVVLGQAPGAVNSSGATGQSSRSPPNSSTTPPNNNGQPYRSGNDFATSAQSAANAAANGLFLLSQAHQELTKREEQQAAQAAAAAAAASASTAANTRSAAARRSSTIADPVATSPTNKRKSMEANPSGKQPAGKRARGSTGSSTAATRSSGRRKKSDAAASIGNGWTTSGLAPSPEDFGNMSMDEDDEDADGDDDMGGHQAGKNPNKKPETEEEKRRNFLERNRQAALKCRQRKKAWLTQLQQKVEYLSAENERLQGTIVSMRDEVTRLSAVVVAHRDCGLGGVVLGVPGHMVLTGPGGSTNGGGAQPISVGVAVNQTGGGAGQNAPPASNGPTPVTTGAGGRSGGGFGY